MDGVYLLTLFAFLTTVSAYLLGPVEALYLKTLTRDLSKIGVVLGIAPIVFILSSPLVGRLSDVLGRKRLLFMLSALGALGPILLVSSKNIVVYALFKILVSVSETSSVLAFALLGDMIEKRKRGGFLFGIYESGPSLGGAVGIFLSGYVASFIGSLSTPYYISSVFSLLSIALLLRIPSEKRTRKKGGKIRRKLAPPLLAVWLLSFLFGLHMGMRYLIWPIIIEKMKGTQLAPFYTSLTWTSMGLLAVLLLAFAGKLSDRYGAMKILFAGWLFSGVIGCLFYFPMDFFPFYLLSVLFSIGEVLRGPSSADISTRFTTPENRGFVFGLLSSSGSFGSFLGPILAGFLTEKFPVNTVLLFYGLLLLLPAFLTLYLMRDSL